MRYTLLEMTQAILGAMDSDEVDSYDDTVESLEVVRCIKESYYDLKNRIELPVHHNLFQLEASGDSTKPVLMTVPTDVMDIDWVKYNKPDASANTEFYQVHFMELTEFMEMMLTQNESDTEISTMNLSLGGDTINFKFFNDRYPSWFTSVDETNLVFDAHLATVDETLRKSKTLCYGKKIDTFTLDNNWTPKLEPEQFGLLLNAAKTQAFYELKQMENAHSQNRYKKNWQHTQRKKYNITNRRDRVPGYGRRPA